MIGIDRAGGTSPAIMALSWRTVSSDWLSIAGGQRADIWRRDHVRQLGRSGDGIWSSARPTSIAALAIQFSRNAASSTRLPRDRLMKACGCMRPSAARPIRFSVCSLATARQTTKSDRTSRSSSGQPRLRARQLTAPQDWKTSPARLPRITGDALAGIAARHVGEFTFEGRGEREAIAPFHFG